MGARKPAIWLLNSLLPGTGLIIRRREWLGLALAIVFSIAGNVFLAGVWIAPETIPGWMTHLAWLMSAAAWALAQYLCLHQGRILDDDARRIKALLSDARGALAQGRLDMAGRALDHAASLDPEHVEVHVLRARVLSSAGEKDAARDAWRLVMKLGPGRKECQEAHNALEALSETAKEPRN